MQRTADVVGRVVRRFYSGAAGESELRALYDAFKDDRCAALREYNGRGPLADFMTLKADAMMGRRLVASFRARRRSAWPTFEHRFSKEIRGAIARFFRQTASAQGVDDLYQEFMLFLIQREYRPIMEFEGSGEASFAWYFKQRVLRNWCIDRQRSPELGGRWRPPEPIKALPELDRRIFEALDRRRLSEQEVKRAFAEVPAREISEALNRIYRVHPPSAQKAIFVGLERINPEGDSDRPQIRADAPGAESRLIAEERRRRLADAIIALPDEDRLILRLWFEHEDFAVVARLSARPIEQVRRIRERAQRKLQAMLRENSRTSSA